MEYIAGLLGDIECEVREVSIDLLEEVLRLQQEVLKTLEIKEFLSPLTKEELIDCITKQLMIGVFVKGELVAFRSLAHPAIDDEHLGYDIGLVTEDLEKVLYQEITVVHPSYRGFGLQKKLGKILMDRIDTSSYTHICATVAPFNFASLKDKLSQGLVIGALKRKYNGKLRYIFYKKLNEERELSNHKIEILMSDIEKQQDLLTKGWIGTSLLKKETVWYVVYEEKGSYI